MPLDIMNLMPKDKKELIECLVAKNEDTRFCAVERCTTFLEGGF